MDSFSNARIVRLRGNYDKYLTAKEDRISIIQAQDGSAEGAKWTVEHIGNNNMRLKSCYGNYLTASTERFLLGATGKKVIQIQPGYLNSSGEWNPIRVGQRLKLQTNSGECLRANGVVPPYLDTVTHKVPLRSPVNKDYLWHVDVLETEVQKPTSDPHGAGTSAKPAGRTSTSAKPLGPTNRPGNSPGQQIKPGNISSTAKDKVMMLGTTISAGTAIYRVFDDDKSTKESSTTMSQPENDKNVADEEHADRETGINEEGDAAIGEEDVANGEEDDAGETEGAYDQGGDADAGSVFESFCSFFQG